MKNVREKGGENSEIRQGLCAQYCNSKPAQTQSSLFRSFLFVAQFQLNPPPKFPLFFSLKMQYARKMEHIWFILRNSIHTRRYERSLNGSKPFHCHRRKGGRIQKSYCFSFRYLFKLISREIQVGPNLSNTQLHIEKPKNCAENR